MTQGQRPASRLLHVGQAPDRLLKTIGPPIQKGSTVLLPDAASLYDADRQTYGRAGLATHDALTDALAELEHASGVRLFPSGLAAMTGALLALLKTGDEVLLVDSIYKPTRRFSDRVLRRFGVSVRYYPPRATATEVMALCGVATRLIVLESPGSLTFEIAGHARHRRRGAGSRRADPDGQHLGCRPLLQAFGSRRGYLRAGPDQVRRRTLGCFHGLGRRCRPGDVRRLDRSRHGLRLGGRARRRLPDVARTADACPRG